MEFRKENEIDILEFSKLLLRNKYFLILFALFGFGIGCIRGLSQQRIWEGQFQIVISDKEDSIPLTNFSATKALSTTSLQKTGIFARQNVMTEIEILKSSSILMPIFENFKQQKLNLEKKDLANLKFYKWRRKALKIRKQQSTSVVNIRFQDTNKKIIVDTLNDISKAYQDYSNKDKKQNITRGISYLEDQKVLLREQSEKSFYKLNNFALKNNMSIDDNLTTEESSVSKTRKVEIPQLLNLPKNTINRNSIILETLSRLEGELSIKESIYREDSEYIKNLKSRINSLKASVGRSKEILSEYRNLKRIASRDENILSNIENQLELLKLKKAQASQPWDVITKTTILDTPVAPERRKIAILFAIFGLFLGILIAYIKEFIDGTIYNIDDIAKYINYEIIADLSNKKDDDIKECINLLVKGKLKEENLKKIAILNTDININEKEEIILQEFKNSFSKKQLLVSQSIQEVIDSEILIILVKIGYIKRNKLKILDEKLHYQSNNNVKIITI